MSFTVFGFESGQMQVVEVKVKIAFVRNNTRIIDRILTTNLIYQTPELLNREWYINCDLSKYIAYIIDTLNHDSSISDLLNPNERIQRIVSQYKNGEL